jgi:hypothetical protein
MKNELALTALAGALMFVAGTVIAGSANKSYSGVQQGVGKYSGKSILINFDSAVLTGCSDYWLL